MIAYANYFTDARIKNYVGALLNTSCAVDVFALGAADVARPGLRFVRVMPKVWSRNVVPYIFSQLWFLLIVLVRVGASFLRQRYDLVHVHNMPDFLVFGALLPRLGGARVILDCHDTTPEAFATKYDLPMNAPLIRMLKLEERLSAAFADHVIVTNDLQKKTLVARGIRAAKISVIMNVAHPDIFVPQRRTKAVGQLTLAYHGTMARRLGIDLILHAFHRARSSCPSIRLILIGDGEDVPLVEGLIDQLRLADAVELRGWIPVEDLSAQLSEVDVGIVGNRLSTETKGNWMLPVKMLEYAAMEIPTIAPRLQIIAHYFDEGSALFYEPDNVEDMARCIVAACEHPGHIVQVRPGLRAFNRKYNWEAMERRYLDLVGAPSTTA